MSLIKLYKENRWFFIGSILFTLICIFILSSYSKAAGFYFLNPYHSHFTDIFFIYFTYLGDGFFCIAIGLLFFLLKKRFLGLMIVSSFVISGAIAQVLKYYILEARPAVYLKDTTYSYFIDNVTLHNLHAFPSGHTASTFALAAVLSFAAKNKEFSILFFLLAVLVGYSRIYLAQHFIDDVLAGAIIGLISAIFCWLFLAKVFNRLLSYKRKIN